MRLRAYSACVSSVAEVSLGTARSAQATISAVRA
ncbi:hypothetical protein SMF913_27648 [Streptomyces malaysiensis]|uniref:Uncharacterized protein n=1 Tax=Streptomyces malaysiensis TaxID=92644 RepID=A0A2J7YVY2_STRMQ|nr:hypothetical protein SMF913_27648 [Streptomyces malaysiensis]